MIDISFLHCGYRSPSAPHRYGRSAASGVDPRHVMKTATSAAQRRPIVVWNFTRTCNLKCVHCYSDSESKAYAGELTTEQGKALLDDLAAFGCPAVLFSGGEPLTRPDLFELAAYARKIGLHTVISTNGTLIDAAMAKRIVDTGFVYVGLSLDSGVPEVHDRFRGMPGAFDRTIAGLRHLVAVGQKVGLRLTLSKSTAENLDAVFDLIEREKINRACFYHLVPAGRGSGVLDVAPADARQAIDTIMARTRAFHEAGNPVEILTVDNHCDGPYLYLKLLAAGDPRAEEVRELLEWNGGGLHSSGVGIACIDPVGNVHPDQFWWHHTLGNVRDRAFSDIWMDTNDPLMAGLKDRADRLKGRCGRCQFKAMCGGALRVRADLMTGDPWMADPGCYLTDGEIGLSAADVAQLKSKGEWFEVGQAHRSPDAPETDRGCTEGP